jgi:hypothetical protein
MMIQIELQPEVESVLAQRAQAQGVALERFVAEIVEAEATAHGVDLQVRPTEAQRRAVEDLIAFRERTKLTLGGLKIKDMVHEGHKY